MKVKIHYFIFPTFTILIVLMSSCIGMTKPAPTSSPKATQTSTILIKNTPSITVSPTSTPFPFPTLTSTISPTPDICNPTLWQEDELYLLSTNLFGAMHPGGPSTFIRILIDKNPAWADFQQEDHGEMRAAGYIFYESSFGPEMGMGANPAVVLVVYGVKNNWAPPVNGDLVSVVYQIRDSLYHDEAEWNFGDIDLSQYPPIANGATYALYRYFDGNEQKLESWCRTYEEVYGESSTEEYDH